MTIRELRKLHKLTQLALAERLGVSQRVISQIETERMAITDAIADRIWDEFGVELTNMEDLRAMPKAGAGKSAQKKKTPPKLEIYVQSPYGGNITPEEIAAKMPEGTESCYVRVDQNLIWWVRGEETGAVEIWNDRA